MNEIITNLWLGNFPESIKHAEEFDVRVCVMDFAEELDRYDYVEYFSARRPKLIYAPVLKVEKEIRETKNGPETFYTDVYLEPHTLNWVSDRIHECLLERQKVIVSCAAAQERSPLTVMYYLWKHRHDSLRGSPQPLDKFDEAYEFVREKHPPSLDRREWLKKVLSYQKEK